MASAGPPAAALKPAPVGTVRKSKWQGCMDEVFGKQRVAGTPEERERYYQVSRVISPPIGSKS